MSTNSLNLKSPISSLYKKPSTTVEKLTNANIITLEDLIWVLPRKTIRLPAVSSFKNAQVDEYFRGNGKVVGIQARPNFKAKGKGKAMLYNITATVQDSISSGIISLKWFNSYSSIQKKIAACESIDFLGVVSVFNDQLQIANPEFSLAGEASIQEGFRIQYPTISTITSTNIKKVIDKVPQYIWDSIPEVLPQEIVIKNSFISRADAFKYIHGKVEITQWSEEHFELAIKRLKYEEFFLDQVKVSLRKKSRSTQEGIIISPNSSKVDELLNIYPYPLTEDQLNSVNDIINDFKSGKPMMRLVQGDVGCGKTTVAVIAAALAISENYQAALMCPTEALALQHYSGLLKVLPSSIKIGLLLGSTSAKNKISVLGDLKSGVIDLVIGTHSLFQDGVEFKNLGLSIIDEQHKFGVEQRLKLVSKGSGSHCLIMSATPIPRSLSLTQYGDLDISIIKTMPSGRKGSQTRIVTPETFPKFLSFLKTRVEMGEQAYILVPAINESPDQNIRDLNNTFEKFKQFFPSFRIKELHGQMKADDKAQTFEQFGNHEIDILIATSVIEVGINVINSTIMAILNPERFGLSSLHQMRGRVGRGEKPGFCFLVTERSLSAESMHRLQVIENNTDGFNIAEEDLKIRGEGDLFGQEQSGVITQRKLANIIIDQDIFYHVIKDFKELESTSEVQDMTNTLSSDEKILSTI
ncbi:ATP-dependent DNA helicase RecG [Bacteriovorax sp. Seq25_V]|uniref:ATP-dependent DNA helicase RecG n=1 Tax=Bacteriovorax sp. Seq25_V TaxID=1201288 RepID=UPI00038A53C9|nr:ATP-dependent DNA helicase RecG [Bacteriovorax sp. Seq25_V]EQC43349.1 putative ATP-dependent DNA helicase RecG [Bacteriovorax sp. Seq25_V]